MGATSSDHGFIGHPELPHGYDPYLAHRREHPEDWMARAALTAAVVGLFPVALGLGNMAALIALSAFISLVVLRHGAAAAGLIVG